VNCDQNSVAVSGRLNAVLRWARVSSAFIVF